jgi:hypothetical protein
VVWRRIILRASKARDAVCQPCDEVVVVGLDE